MTKIKKTKIRNKKMKSQKTKIIKKTKTQQKTKMKNNKNREQVQIAVESVRGGARCLWRIGFEKKESLEIEMKE